MARWVCFDHNYDGKAPSLWLSAEESHHLGKVLRARVGDRVKLLNGRGLIADCTVKTLRPDTLELAVEGLLEKQPPSPRVDLVLGLAKPKALESILRQATEMSVASIQFLECDHAAYSLEASSQKWERFQDIIIEACKQSLNPFIPILYKIVPFKAYVAQCSPDPRVLKLVASLEPSARPLSQYTVPKPESLLCFVGPEGDFSAREYAKLSGLGALDQSLGGSILRVETAVVAMLAQVELFKQQWV